MAIRDAVMLMYDERRRSIGVRAASISRQNAYPLLGKNGPGRKPSFSRIISASDFCKHFGITAEGTLAFKKPEVTAGVLVLDLNETRPAKNA